MDLKKTYAAQRGFTLTEIVIVLGIIGMILGATWVAGSSVYASQRMGHAQTAIMQIAQSIRSLYATSNTAAGLTTANLIAAGAVPSDWIDTAGTGMISPFTGGTTTVQPTTDGLGFVITMTNAPQAACVGLMLAIAGPNRDPSLFLAMAPGAPSAANIATAQPVITVPMTSTITTAATVTGAGNGLGEGGCTATTATNQVSFGFGLK